MRKGKHIVKRLITVWLSAALAMGAPGSAFVSVASEVESVEAQTSEVSGGNAQEDTEALDPDNDENIAEGLTDDPEGLDGEEVLDVEEDNSDEADDLEASKQAAKDNQKHPVENISNSAAVNRASIHDGAILHAFCWNFNTIKENMKTIADAGFTAIQTSPINACLDIYPGLKLNSGNDSADGMWYYHYQPTDWTIGNYQLGSREEFIEMCNEADKYGIGVIVDILPNHTTPVREEVSENMLAAVGGWDNLFHKDYTTAISSWSDRANVTYYAMGGLPDVDTENTDFQDYFYAYLDDCINCGADGFRIDTAKHIALPDDPVPGNYAGDEGRNTFYPNMVAALNEYANETGNGKCYDNLFVYGEVLQGDNERLAAYQHYIGGTTASNYGGTIRNAIAGDNVLSDKISNYGIGDDGNYAADNNKLVTWVESHDNYMNDGSYNVLGDNDTVEAWAIIAARKDGTPLFFSRPNGSSQANPWGDNVLGAAGNDLYFSPEVTAVNNFRKAMNGNAERLSNPGGNMHVIMVERGDDSAEGAVLVNTANYPVEVKGDTTLPDGNYVNKVSGKNDLFIVKDGKIDGVIQKEAVVVLTEATSGSFTTVHFNNRNNWSTVYAIVDDDETPVTAISENDGWFRINVPSESFRVVFTNGTDRTDSYSIENGKEGFITPEKSEIYESKALADDALGLVTDSVYFFNTDMWEAANIYSWYEDNTKPCGEWPGKNTYDEGGYWIRADIKLPKDRKDEKYYVIFNTDGIDGQGKAQTVNIEITDDRKYIAPTGKDDNGNFAISQFASKEEAEETLGISANKTTVHFYNKDNWDTVYAYTWEAYSFGEWPGTPCEEEGDGWWKITVPAAAGSNFNIIFNNAGNGKQTADLKVLNIKSRYVYDDRCFASKEEAVGAPEEEIVLPFPEGTPLTQIYYYDDNDWGKCHAYIWSLDSAYNNTVGAWPGLRMYSEGDGWYYTYVPTEAIEKGNLNLIISRGGASQLDDKALADTENVYFNTNTKAGYASKELALKNKNGETEEPGTEEPGKEEPGTETPGTTEPETPGTTEPETPGTTEPEIPGTTEPEIPGTTEPETPGTTEPETPGTTEPETPGTTEPETPGTTEPETPGTTEPQTPGTTQPQTPGTTESQTPSTTAPETQETPQQETPSVTTPETSTATAPETPVVITPATPEKAQVNTSEVVEAQEQTIPVTGIKLNRKKVKIGRTGTYQLEAQILPGDATNKEIIWSSSDEKIATVNETGLVKAKKKGDCVITATTKDGEFKSECKITVTKKVKVTGVKLNKKNKSLSVGKTYTLKASLKPRNATNKEVKWSSSNNKVAKVDANGKVTAIGKGDAVITVTTKEGDYTATCKFTVKKAKTNKTKKDKKKTKK